jgi:LDH2 family malate/lactate/ureidoglycolate dehydrogenase
MDTGARLLTYKFDDLFLYAAALLRAAGLDGDKPQVTARLLVAADAMGHDTHGLAQLSDYLDDIATGAMLTSGEPEILVDRPAACVWDGRTLPGVWLVDRAVRLAAERAKTHGVCAIAIRRSHHVACLATYLTTATEQGMMAIVACSDPSEARVAPFGGRRAVFMPDPIAIGIPTRSDPILIDFSTSITTMAMVARLRRTGQKFPGVWAIDADGAPTDDPNAVADGALLPVGGVDHGHKGTGLAWMVEALTQGLAGYGRADPTHGWGGSVFVQVFDPALFAGRDDFTRQTEWIAEACRATPSGDPAGTLRLPGARALAGLRRAREQGLAPRPEIMAALAPWAERFGVRPPAGAA